MSRETAYAYLALWGVCCVGALGLAVSRRKDLAGPARAYARFLGEPWKLVTFALGAGFFVLAAPYTGDPTWDRTVGGMMSALTFLSAPAAVGVVYRELRSRAPTWRLYLAAVAWLLSASWCYDAYLLMRDGYYPSTWLTNLFASGLLYLTAGLFWNLTYRDGVTLAFLRDDWFSPVKMGGRALLLLALGGLVVSGIGVAALWPFLVEVADRLRAAK